ncbi:restriction endonuclease subunit M [Planctomycetales bacterium]|nr:restriction endonuclease subunit M [Planctomycetales bacterium]GHT36084.1 restriction endonuclease subunit M [Planctomycetales bacterium]
MGRLILGDCLEVMKKMPAESVDLIYLDPPFFSNRNYEMIWGDENEKRSFIDRWDGGVDKYAVWLRERVVEMHRLLKPTGAIFLHCDHHANAYIRIYVLDKVFGDSNFRNEITWRRTNAKSNATQRFAVNTDTIFFYAKSDTFELQPVKTDYSVEQMGRYKQFDEKGYYRCDDLTAPGTGRQFEWRGLHPGKNRSWRFDENTLERLIRDGLIVFQQDGRPRKDGLKSYQKNAKGAFIDNLWDDIQRVGNTSKERIGYPTQKPEALLERIIECASKENDIVFDPFIGGGTTAAVAQRLQREWIACDISPIAASVTQYRLEKKETLFYEPIFIETHVYNIADLKKKKPFDFQCWIIERFDGMPGKKGGDGGIDGLKNGLPIQVKQSEHIGRIPIDNFKSSMQRYDTNCKEGYFIAFSFGSGAKNEVARLKNEEGITIHLIEVKDVIPLTSPPDFTVDYQWEESVGGRKNITFTVKSDQDLVSVQFDWTYDGEDFRPDDTVWVKNREPAAVPHIFDTGLHTYAIRAADEEGTQSTISNKISVNGGVREG